MSDATKLRKYTDRSNKIHEEYLGDPALLRRYERFVTWQLAYMLPFYEDLRKSDEYAAAVDFFVSDLTGINISQRDQELARVVPIMSRMLPGRALHAIATAMELNARVLGINLSICRELYKEISVDARISESDYCSACRRASRLDECLELVHLTAKLGRNLDHVIQLPLIGPMLKAMRTPARLAGFGALQRFLESGHTTFSALDDVDLFLELATHRMTEVFTRIFSEPIGDLRQ